MPEATIHDKRASVIKNMRDLINKADAEEGRSLTADETSTYKKMEADFVSYTETIDLQDKQAKMEAVLAQPVTDPIRDQPNSPAFIKGTDRPKFDAIMDAYGRALCADVMQLQGAPAFTDDHRKILKAALEQGTDTSGGYLVPPMEFVTALIKKIDDLVWIRSRATIHTLTQAKSLGAVSLDTDPDDAEWTQEVGTVPEDTAMKFGKRELSPNLLSKLIKVSMRLLDTGVISVEQLIIERMAYKFSITEEKHYLTGSGAKQPLGLFTASADGISTNRDVSENMTTTAITGDGLINVKYSLKGQYWNQAEWLFHRDAMKQIVKLKDSQNRYLFLESLRAGDPDQLLGRPIMMSEYVPNTFTTGLYVGMFGDFSKYWIVDALSMTMQRLVEKYAENNQIGFIGRKETDGMPVLEEAFARVTLA